MQVLFIGGQVRSGSTLLERLLGELPGVCSLGEVAHLWERVGRSDVRCGCGSGFADCDFWAEVGDRAFGGWGNVDLDRLALLWRRVGRTRHAVRRIGPRSPNNLLAQTTEYTDYYHRIYTAAAATAGARIIVDSSKNPGLVSCLRWARGLDLRVVHLVRDPRGVTYSLTKHQPSLEREGGTNIRMSPLASALQWTGANAALELLSAVGRRSGGPATPAPSVCRIRYEDLIGDPAGTVRALARFAGLDLTDDSFSYLNGEYADLGVIHSAGGNPMRFVRGSVPLRHDDAWRTALPPRHRALVGVLCLPLILAYGYLPHARSAAGRRAGRPPYASKPPGPV